MKKALKGKVGAMARWNQSISMVLVVLGICFVCNGDIKAAELDGVLHPFGEDTQTYPNEFDLETNFPAFTQVFDLHVSDGVSMRWTQAEWQYVISSIMNNNTEAPFDDDIFGIVWGYFTRVDADADDSHAGIEYVVGSNTYTKITIKMYDTDDLPDPCSWTYSCNGYSSAGNDYLIINASPANATDYVLGQAIAHELAHVSWLANGLSHLRGFGYDNAFETMSTLAEYLLDSWRPHVNDLSYDSSFLRSEVCDPYNDYIPEKIWITYLYETFKGDAGPEDDLVYRWINSGLPWLERMKLTGLANTLWHADFAWVGGVDATDRLTKVYSNFLAAKFCNAGSFGQQGEFGVGDANTFVDFGLFQDNCVYYEPGAVPMPVDCPRSSPNLSEEWPLYEPGYHGCWNVRVILPEHELSAIHQNTLTTVAGTYTDGDAPLPAGDGDGSSDLVDVWQYGTDYVVFRADEYYQDGEEHEFEIQIRGDTKYDHVESQRLIPVGWVMGYTTDSAALQTHPEALVFIEPLTFSPPTTLGDPVVARTVTVTGFGSAIKSVVIAVGASSPYADMQIPINAFVYEYDFGVFTADTGTRTWGGDVYVTSDVTVPAGALLQVSPGTICRVHSSDLGGGGDDPDRIEFNVEGALVADGTVSEPIVFESWPPTTTEDWVGISFSSQSSGGTFNYCSISRAQYGIVTEATSLAVVSSTIADCGYAGVTSEGASAHVIGCVFDGNTVGVHCNNTGTAVTIKNNTIENSDGNGILCDNYSHPLIEGNTIRSNGAGLFCNNGSSPTIRANTITSNTTGIAAAGGANPDIGRLPSLGNNTIAYSTNWHVINFNQTGTLYAQSNCWNSSSRGCGPKAHKIAGSVDTTSPLCCSVSPVFPGFDPDPDETPGETMPAATKLLAAVPNPFNPTTTIRFSVGESAGSVRLVVYDVGGRLVRELVSGEMSQGTHEVVWDGTDYRGQSVASAVYFARLSAGQQTETMKLVLLK